MQDYYQLELDDMVIALNNKDAVIELLQKKLSIATKALEKYKRDYFITEYGGRSVNPYPDIARKALKEMEGVK